MKDYGEASMPKEEEPLVSASQSSVPSLEPVADADEIPEGDYGVVEAEETTATPLLSADAVVDLLVDTAGAADVESKAE